ncbi:glycosyltransferase family 92 protein RCOM_0530710 isoform X2 [Salvia miltiorrhiza]|uniref:glycosyltransferase family 92 protein RCOM_0530710 isoform X2 n=1 Tax=Salvia miltiorrhiza TaxID=226208 RepID=UPI0025ABD115|nr:glycosyltransferase family 92 protein RCOM_0530710 isoform X2 [Salvia miltiorrhiza]
MKDRRKRSVFSWQVLFFFLTIVLLFLAAFASSVARLWLAGSFQPRLIPKRNIPAMEVISAEKSQPPAVVSVRETVIFPDEAVVFLKYPSSAFLFTRDDINCIYLPPNSSQPRLQLPPSAVDSDGESHHIVRCPAPPRGSILSLLIKHNGNNLAPGPMHRWDSLAYEAMIDNSDNTTLVFVKGLNLRSGRPATDPNKFKCVYGLDSAKPRFVLSADAVSAAQEVVRCRTPSSILNGSHRFSPNSDNSIKVSVRVVGRHEVDSVARLKSAEWSPKPAGAGGRGKQHKMCVCTMLRNQARFLPEWIMYHGRVGVERWFVYDNNSDDDVEGAVGSLAGAGHNVTRHLWPWIKTQEAGFAHCAMRARGLCEWVGFIDVDEFLHLPSGLSLYDDVVRPLGAGEDVGEVRVACHSFGASGLREAPARGVMAGYTCRLAAPERHKSIVRPEALDSSLINLVHHFHLKAGFRHVNVKRSVLVINHYKYQVWEVFKEKFYRRVATYVSDWQQERNVGSKDRAPGLGTKAVEPSDWPTRFCEVKDTGLRDRIMDTFTDPQTGKLPWEDQQRSQT